MSRFVWRVEVQGTERLEPEVITAALAEYGVRSGALASGIDARTVERQMQIRFEEIAWITVNVEGSRVTAIIEAVPPRLWWRMVFRPISSRRKPGLSPKWRCKTATLW